MFQLEKDSDYRDSDQRDSTVCLREGFDSFDILWGEIIQYLPNYFTYKKTKNVCQYYYLPLPCPDGNHSVKSRGKK